MYETVLTTESHWSHDNFLIIQLSPEKEKITVMVNLVLHMLHMEAEENYTPPEFLDTDKNVNITQGG